MIIQFANKNLIWAVLLVASLSALLGCAGADQPLPRTPAALHLSPLQRSVYRDGFRAGLSEVKQQLSAEHKRHPFPAADEEYFRCGYIKGLIYNWPTLGAEERVRLEYPAYLDAYSKQVTHWGGRPVPSVGSVDGGSPDKISAGGRLN